MIVYKNDENSSTITSISSPYYDLTTRTVAFRKANTIQTYDGTDLQTVITEQQLIDAGFPNYRFNKVVLSEGEFTFMATSFTGGDKYSILRFANNNLTPLVTPDTNLPMATGTGKPYYFPNFLAAKGSSVAFDTSAARGGTVSIYACFGSAVSYQIVVSKGDTISYGKLTDFGGLNFNTSGDLEVIGLVGTSKYRLTYNASGLISIVPLSLSAPPINAGKLVVGEIKTNSTGVQILDTDSEIFMKSGEGWYRVIGAGDVINGEKIAYLSFLAARKDHPDRIIVEIRIDPTDEVRQVELELTPAQEQSPRFGATYVHPESHELYIPLSHLTYGREYVVSTSSDLKTWSQLQEIQKITPLQHVRIPVSDLHSPSFFRVEEK